MESAASQNEKKETDKGSVNRPVCSKDIANSIEEAIKNIQKLKRFFDNRDNSELSDEILEDILEVSKFLQRVMSKEAVKHHTIIADRLAKENIVDLMCPLIDIVYDGKIKNHQLSEFCINALRSIQAFTACSEKFCIAICENPPFFDTMKKVLESPKDVDSLFEVMLFLRNIILRESLKSDTIKDNNQRLGNVNFLELLVEFEKKAKTEEDKLECVKTILALTSDADNRKTMVTDSRLCVIDQLLLLTESDQYPDKVGKDLRNICDIILWKLREELLDSEKYHKLGASYYKNSEKNTVKKQHIMISYQWDKKDDVNTIKKRLEVAGHKVLMEMNEGGDCVLQNMAHAVEEARIVLICITKKYEDSTNCQLEVEYALQLQKRIIPLKFEHDHEPRGLVGLIVKTHLVHEFTAVSHVDNNMPGLLEKVAKVIADQRSTAEVATQTPHVPTVKAVETQTPKVPTTIAVETQTPQVPTVIAVETQTPQVPTVIAVETQTPQVPTTIAVETQTPQVPTVIAVETQTPQVPTTIAVETQTPQVPTTIAVETQTPQVPTTIAVETQTPQVPTVIAVETQTPQVPTVIAVETQTVTEAETETVTEMMTICFICFHLLHVVPLVQQGTKAFCMYIAHGTFLQ